MATSKSPPKEPPKEEEKKLENPFPDPTTVDQAINVDVLKKIRAAIELRTYDFHSLVKSFQVAVETKRIKYAKIIGYYCINALINTDKVSMKDKHEIKDQLLYNFITAFNQIT